MTTYLIELSSRLPIKSLTPLHDTMREYRSPIGCSQSLLNLACPIVSSPKQDRLAAASFH